MIFDFIKRAEKSKWIENEEFTKVKVDGQDVFVIGGYRCDHCGYVTDKVKRPPRRCPQCKRKIKKL